MSWIPPWLSGLRLVSSVGVEPTPTHATMQNTEQYNVSARHTVGRAPAPITGGDSPPPRLTESPQLAPMASRSVTPIAHACLSPPRTAAQSAPAWSHAGVRMVAPPASARPASRRHHGGHAQRPHAFPEPQRKRRRISTAPTHAGNAVEEFVRAPVPMGGSVGFVPVVPVYRHRRPVQPPRKPQYAVTGEHHPQYTVFGQLPAGGYLHHQNVVRSTVLYRVHEDPVARNPGTPYRTPSPPHPSIPQASPSPPATGVQPRSYSARQFPSTHSLRSNHSPSAGQQRPYGAHQLPSKASLRSNNASSDSLCDMAVSSSSDSLASMVSGSTSGGSTDSLASMAGEQMLASRSNTTSPFMLSQMDRMALSRSSSPYLQGMPGIDEEAPTAFVLHPDASVKREPSAEIGTDAAFPTPSPQSQTVATTVCKLEPASILGQTVNTTSQTALARRRMFVNSRDKSMAKPHMCVEDKLVGQVVANKARSCQGCVRDKKKCDRGHDGKSCTRCTKKKRECVMPSKMRKRKPNKHICWDCFQAKKPKFSFPSVSNLRRHQRESCVFNPNRSKRRDFHTLSPPGSFPAPQLGTEKVMMANPNAPIFSMSSLVPTNVLPPSVLSQQGAAQRKDMQLLHGVLPSAHLPAFPVAHAAFNLAEAAIVM